MAHGELAERIEALLAPVAESHGFELVTVEQAGGRATPVIRVLIDREGGIDLDAITSANAWVNEALEASDPMPGPYTLEVSSPGVDRPLTKRADFARFKGETATVKARPAGIGARSAWTGVLLGMEGDDIVLDVEGERVTVAFDDIIKARLKGVVSFNKERGAC